ncbi:MAG: glycoside hydrolase domain-containing protein, partial [Carbonactinosporaceae bacterium]
MARTYRTRVAVAAGSAAMFVPALVAAAPDAGTTKTVTFRGYNVEVPASWPVYNLSESPETCVRFDRHAVYLGRPGTEQDCPSHAAGRTEAMLLAPAEGVGPRFASGLEGGVRRLFADDGVALTATYAAHPELIENALRSGPGAGRAVDV